jgi:hypothetical protein
MDPDAKKQSIDLARAIGLHKTYIIIPPEKIDDAINRYSVTTPELRRYLRYAPIKASAFIRPEIARKTKWAFPRSESYRQFQDVVIDQIPL